MVDRIKKGSRILSNLRMRYDDDDDDDDITLSNRFCRFAVSKCLPVEWYAINFINCHKS